MPSSFFGHQPHQGAGLLRIFLGPQMGSNIIFSTELALLYRLITMLPPPSLRSVKRIFQSRKHVTILRLSYEPFNSHYSNDRSFFHALDQHARVYFVNLATLSPDKAQSKIERIIKKTQIDFIYKSYMKNRFDSLKLHPLHDYGIPTVWSVGDCHSRISDLRFKSVIHHHKPDGLIVNNKSAIPHLTSFIEYPMKYIWIPWAYNPKFNHPYGLSKNFDVTIPAGNFKIPIRQAIHGRLKNDPSIRYQSIFAESKYGAISFREYSKIISDNLIAISTCQHDDKQHAPDGSFIGMTFTKWFEIPMCGTLHIGQRSADCHELGFENHVNAVMFDSVDEFAEKFKYFLAHPQEQRRIITNARELIRDEHTYSRRALSLIREMQSL
jgi:hypothetical protein